MWTSKHTKAAEKWMEVQQTPFPHDAAALAIPRFKPTIVGILHTKATNSGAWKKLKAGDFKGNWSNSKGENWGSYTGVRQSGVQVVHATGGNMDVSI